MANQQVFPQSTYPLGGDIQSSPGSPRTTVVGIQNTAVASAIPTDQQVLVFQASQIAYVPTSVTLLDNDSVSINGVAVSDSYDIAFNLPVGPAGTPVEINGSLV